MTTVSLIFIRETAEQLTGSACCGKVEGDAADSDTSANFRATRADQYSHAALIRFIRDRFGAEGAQAPDITIVDPRNQLYLGPKLIREVFRHRPHGLSGLRTVLQCFAVPAIILNGRVIASGNAAPDPEAICNTIAKETANHA
ncbi:MAG: hypothetical protein ACI9OU_000978 [Candidatus Promineifilaceae bacterium]|jgi:hypothetical protein